MLVAEVSFLIKGNVLREGQQNYISVQIRSFGEKPDALKMHNFVTFLLNPGLYNFILRAYPNSVRIELPSEKPLPRARGHTRANLNNNAASRRDPLN